MTAKRQTKLTATKAATKEGMVPLEFCKDCCFYRPILKWFPRFGGRCVLFSCDHYQHIIAPKHTACANHWVKGK